MLAIPDDFAGFRLVGARWLSRIISYVLKGHRMSKHRRVVLHLLQSFLLEDEVPLQVDDLFRDCGRLTLMLRLRKSTGRFLEVERR